MALADSAQVVAGTQHAQPEGGADSGKASPAPLPTISHPKGGGAIRGVGEKFAANPATGSGTMSVPIALSSGRAGFGPSLTLNYDSSNGNGPFGFGWVLSHPNIARRTAKGVPRYRESSEPDVFVISGAEDLVPVLDADGLPYEDRARAPDHVIHRYRPRVEGLFARIERWTQTRTGVTHWRTISRENVTTVYGLTPSSRIADPDRPERIFRWLICESYDDKGNAMRYDYVSEDSAGVDLARGSERSRSRGANRYLKRIRYGNRVSRLLQPDLSKADWMFEAVFDYDEGHVLAAAADGDEHDYIHASATPTTNWAARPDPFSDYRSGFEMRTHRRCHRVLMFHDFPELGTGPTLVRSTEFSYDDPDAPFASIEDELAYPGSTRIASFLSRVTQAGYIRQDDGRYLSSCYPPVEFSYSKARIDDTLRTLDADSAANLPAGIAGRTQWADLDGDGAPGILTREAGAWHYKPNLGKGRFGPSRVQPSQPSLAGGGRLMDLSGDGQLDLVAFDGPQPGFYERDTTGGWQGFRPFDTLPRLNWNDPNLRLVDLSGDGLADVVITQQTRLLWHRSLGEQGFAAPETVYHDWAAQDGPQLVFDDGQGAIFLADMSGDGLPDIVRIGNGEVAYWPSRGHGEFGARVAMDNAPRFDRPDQFDRARLHLADIDGSGTTDIIYLGGDGARLYFNLSGNGWSHARKIAAFPAVVSSGQVTTADLLGNGTSCLVWSNATVGGALQRVHYIDLMGGQKPHLMIASANNLGTETRIQYAASTKFALADKAAGQPWITRLPFPVHVVERVETVDHIGRTRFAARYSYHQGHYDGQEREFRGFALVEQTDTEEFAALSADPTAPSGNIAHSSHVPEVFTRSFFHTGMDPGGDHVTDPFASLSWPANRSGYFREPGLDDAEAAMQLLPDTTLPDGLSAADRQEACRALRGSLLRQEVYSLDGGARSELPHSVTERAYCVRKLQERGANPHAVFFVHEREQRIHNYDRTVVRQRAGVISSDISDPKAITALDPRVSHTLTLEADIYGTPLKTVTIGYGRRHVDPNLPSELRAAQAKTQVTYGDTRVTTTIDTSDAWRTPIPCDTRSYELTGYVPTGPGNRFQPEDFGARGSDGTFSVDFDSEIGFEELPGSGRSRRILARSLTLYRRDDLTGPLPLGQIGALGLTYESYTLALTSGLVEQIYGDRLDSEALLECGYVPLEGAGWWVPSGRVFFSPGAEDPAARELRYARDHFFLPLRARDAFHTPEAPTESLVRYDRYSLLVAETIDARGNRMTVGERGQQADAPIALNGQDYRVLGPALVMDANRNRVATAYDALGMVAGTAVMGKPEERLGDGFTPDFNATLNPSQIAAFAANPDAVAPELLQGATSRIVQDIHAFARSRDADSPQPIMIGTLSREVHESDLAAGTATPIRLGIAYSDGFGRAIQMKLPAGPGAEPERDVNGKIVLDADHQPKQSDAHAARRWICSGWTIYNNKGKPVRSFEPFFTDVHQFEFNTRIGQSPVLFYDPLSRVIGTLNPDQTWCKSVFDPWRAEIWDVADTLLLDPTRDPELGDHLSRLPPDSYRPGWYARRIDGGLGPHEQMAAQEAENSADTPTTLHSDSLGRTILKVQHNRIPTDPPSPQEYPATRVSFDIQGHPREIYDAKARLTVRNNYDMSGAHIATHSMESGVRRTLNDVLGKSFYAWNDRGHRIRIGYDTLRRQVASFLRHDGGPEQILTRNTYGEDHPEAQRRNLRGRLIETCDQAGIVITDRFDFKGNALASTRRLLTGYREQVDWTDPPELARHDYTSHTRFDALDRPIQMVPPQSGRGGKPSVIEPSYDAANRLERLSVWLDRDAMPDGRLTDTDTPPAPVGITWIDYDAKGQRQRVDYANGTTTHYHYDPLTFRLTGLETTRDGARLQDLRYTYEPMGNVVRIGDEAQQDIYFRNAKVEATATYLYDALYRLIRATGREHLGQGGQPPDHRSDERRAGLHPEDGAAMGRYLERYAYDIADNMTVMRHHSAAETTRSWTRQFSYDEQSLLEPEHRSNRLSAITTGDALDRYDSYDAHGNMLSLPYLSDIAWDHADQLRMTRRQEGGGDCGRTWYVYDSAGQRVRKVTEDASGAIRHERIYLGGFEIYRCHGPDPLTRETLHLMDDQARIALVETRVSGAEPGKPARLIRYQLADHLGHSRIELDDRARILSIEEYAPWRSTTYQGVRSQTQTPKRYRAGKERDDETGFYYHGMRYYAPWLCRWISIDPAGSVDGLNLYRYAKNNPINNTDSTGLYCDPTMQSCVDPAANDGSIPWTFAGSSAEPAAAQTQSIPEAAPGTDFAREAARGRAAFRAANDMAPGEQAQHWTKEISAREANIAPEIMNENMSPLQSRNALPARTLLVDPEGGGTRYSVEGGSTYGNEHKFADRFLIRQIEAQMRAANPQADPKVVAIEAGRQARWVMTGEPGPTPVQEPTSRNSSGGGAVGTVVNGAVIAGILGRAATQAHEGDVGDAATTLGVGAVALKAIQRYPALVPLAVMASSIEAYDEEIEQQAFEDGDWWANNVHPVLGAPAAAASATGRSVFEGTFGVTGRAIGEGTAAVYIRATSDDYTLVPWRSQIWSDIFD